MRHDPTVRSLADLFPGCRWLYIRRRDRIGQAVSVWRAIKSGRWHSPDTATADERPPYDFFPILTFYQSILTEESLWRAFFVRQPEPPLVIDCEDLEDDPRPTFAAVVRHLRGPGNTDGPE